MRHTVTALVASLTVLLAPVPGLYRANAAEQTTPADSPELTKELLLALPYLQSESDADFIINSALDTSFSARARVWSLSVLADAYRLANEHVRAIETSHRLLEFFDTLEGS